jgi:hypothetical protein
MSDSIIITDGDLQAYLLSRTGETIEELQAALCGSMTPSARWNASALLMERERRNQGEAWQKTLAQTFKICPHNLAERFLEATLIYRVMGSAFLPDLLPLSLILLQADLHSYFTPSDKPYRDHLPHQTRVAALAHLLLSGKLPLKRWNDFVDQQLEHWFCSTEHTLLVDHLSSLELEDGLPSNDQEVRECWLAAALLAGLVHDVGYALKYLLIQGGSAAAALRRFGIYPEGGMPADDPPRAPITQMYRSFFQESGPGQAMDSFGRYVTAHPTSPHSLAGALWLAYLPERLVREGIIHAPRDRTALLSNGRRASLGRFELIAQLAAMMSLAHDLPLDSKSKQGEQGFHKPWGKSETELDHYPACAFFTLADVLHELGRPVIFTGPKGLSVASPIQGLELVAPDEWSDDQGDSDARKNANKLCQDKGLLSEDEAKCVENGPRIELFWVVDENVADDALYSAFELKHLGGDVPPRLKELGFAEILCQRDVSAAQTVEKSGKVHESIIHRKKRGLRLRPDTLAAIKDGLALYPLSRYADEVRKVREELMLGPLR